MTDLTLADMWSRRLDRLESTWLRDVYGMAPLTATQRVTLTRQLAAARASHRAACRRATARPTTRTA